MSKVVNRKPLQRLSGRVAQPKVMAGMTWSKRAVRTCSYCDITYLGPDDATACEAWHEGKGQ